MLENIPNLSKMENNKYQQKRSSSDLKAWVTLGVMAVLAIAVVSAIQKDWGLSEKDRSLIEYEEKLIADHERYMIGEAMRDYETDSVRFRDQNLRSALETIKSGSKKRLADFKQMLKDKAAQGNGG
jgi:hypothetical protein